VSIVRDRRIKTFNTTIFDRVLKNGTLQEKKNLAEQLGTLTCDTAASRLEREAIVPILIRLAADPAKDVRVLLASILVGCEKLHPDLLFSIIADDADIALPFLSSSPALDRRRTLAILKVGDKARQLVLAARASLCGDAISFIADKCDSDVCVLLLDNKDISIKVQDYRRLYVRFRDVPEVTELLLQRSDLPLEVRILQAKRASGRVQQLMAQRGWIATQDADEIIVDAQETTFLRILATANLNEIDNLIRFLSSKSLLTPSLILRAACSGNLSVVGSALSFLSTTPRDKIQKMFDDRAAVGIKNIYHRAGLPKNCFHIVRAAVDVSADMKDMPNEARRLRFGSAIIECLMTRYNSISTAEKSALLEIVARLSDENTRNLARRLAGQLKAA